MYSFPLFFLGFGDDTRTWGPPFCCTESAYFISVNRNKKVTLSFSTIFSYNFSVTKIDEIFIILGLYISPMYLILLALE